MNSEEEASLSQFLASFDTTGLGEGDPIVGANLLAGMACTLANLAPDDGSVVTRKGVPARLGASLLVTGSASTGRVVDEIITEVGRRQKNFAAHLRLQLDALDELSRKQGAALPPTGLPSTVLDNMLNETQLELEGPFRTRLESWKWVLAQAPGEQINNLVCQPKFLVTAARPGDLEAQLKGLRPGRPLVHLGFARPADLAAFSELGAALLEGRHATGGGCDAVRANIIITDPMRMLGEAAKAPDDRTAWLEQFLWLCDGSAGPDAPADIAGTGPKSAEAVTVSFLYALGNVIATRMNIPGRKPAELGLGSGAARRWTGFLREMEPRLPGVSGAARNLLASLVFGIRELAKTLQSYTYSEDGVEAFARFLIHRMANARAAMLFSAEKARHQHDKRRILVKLAAVPNDNRTIYRHLSLPPAYCEKLLLELETEGLVRRTGFGRKWERLESATSPNASLHLQSLDV